VEAGDSVEEADFVVDPVVFAHPVSEAVVHPLEEPEPLG